jgi:hypothetical protein
MREAAISAGVPRSSVYDVTLYLLAGLLVIGLIANIMVRPVGRKWFMSDADIAALQVRGDVSTMAGFASTGGISPAAVLAWAAVGIPILWGVWITLDKVAVLFM